MPIQIPADLPARAALESESIFVMTEDRATRQDIRPLEIAIVNLMPTKIATETQLLRLLGNTALQVNITLLRTAEHQSKNTPVQHLERFYKTFDEIRHRRFDGMIVTGAPVEHLPFEQVDYWEELLRIMTYANENAFSTLYICWAAQAALYHFYGIRKHALPQKLSGVYPHHSLVPTCPLFRGFDDEFLAPHSRNTEVRRIDVEGVENLRILAESDEAGLAVVESLDHSQVFMTGHLEYDRGTLDAEYRLQGVGHRRGGHQHQGCQHPRGDPPQAAVFRLFHLIHPFRSRRRRAEAERWMLPRQAGKRRLGLGLPLTIWEQTKKIAAVFTAASVDLILRVYTNS